MSEVENPKAKNAAWLKQLRAEGVIETPESEPIVEEGPDPAASLPARLLWVQQAFCALSRCRTVNECGPQPMMFADLKAYCDLTGIFDETSRRDLIYFLTELDIRYLKITHANIRKAREEAERKAKREADKRRRR